ncbi:hypothetical protein EV360DRAFT_89058 [Lentinula raphanica]|nr:hypothetical protein EV360DRAFT_89058 [Lentinula raphanica]
MDSIAFSRKVVQRVTLERGTLKGFSTVVLSAYGIDESPEGITKARELLREGLYIYPLDAKGKYRYDRPFGHDAFTKYMKEAFFGNSKFANNFIAPYKRALFKSSSVVNPNRALEFELPKAMLAMAGSVIHAILQDVGESKRDNFPPPGLSTQWHTLIVILDNLEAHDKPAYHAYIHKLYKKASNTVGLANHGLSRREVLNRLDLEAWSRNDTDEDSGMDEDGHNKDGYNEGGHNEDGYNEDGHNEDE